MRKAILNRPYPLRIIGCWLALWALTAKYLNGQTLVARKELKEFEQRTLPFPFETYPLQASGLYVAHPVMLRIHEGAFALLYIHEKDKFRHRRLERYNLLLELEWSQAFEIETNEEILELLQNTSHLIVLSRRDGTAGHQAQVIARAFDLATGEPAPAQTLAVDPKISDFMVAVSPDSSRFALFSFHTKSDLQRARIIYDYLYTDDRIAYQVSLAEEVRFSQFDLSLKPLASGVIPVRKDKENLSQSLIRHCGVDNDGRVFVTLHRKKTQLSVLRWSDGELMELSRADFFKLHEFTDVFNTHLPPLLHGGNLYLARADREKRGWRKVTQAFELMEFDFGPEAAVRVHRAPTTSTLLVQIEKNRADFGVRPLRVLDQYRIRGLFAVGDTSIWLATQYLEYRDAAPINYGDHYMKGVRGAGDQRISEVVLYEFDALKRPRKAIIIPSMQFIRDSNAAISRFAHLWFDRSQGFLHVLTMEPSQNDLKGPDRLYFKQVGLSEGALTPRKIFYEGRRRNQYLLLPYVCWLDSRHAVFMLMDGDLSRPYLLVIRLEDGTEDFDALRFNAKDNW